MAYKSELAFIVKAQGINKTKADLAAMGTTGTKSTTAMTAGFNRLKLAVGGIGLALVAKEAVSMATSFQASMNDVQEKLNLTGDAMVEVKNFALDMGATTAFSASEAGDALSDLAALGLDASESMKALPDVLNLAASSGLTLDDAARKTAVTLKQFGLDVDQSTRVVDLLAGAADSSAANVSYLTEVFGKAGPTATELGVSMEELASAAGVLADKGVKAEIAATGLKNIMPQLITPSNAVAEKLGLLGIKVEDFVTVAANGERQFIGLGAAFDLIKDSGADVPAVMEILGREMTSLLPVVRGGSELMQGYADATDAAASASKQAQTQMQGLPGAFKLLSSAWQAVNLAVIGSGELIETTIRGLAKLLIWLAQVGVPAIQVVYEAFKSLFTVDIDPVTGQITRMGTAMQILKPIVDGLITGFKLVWDLIKTIAEAFIALNNAIPISDVKILTTVLTALGKTLGVLAPAIVLIGTGLVAAKVATIAWGKAVTVYATIAKTITTITTAVKFLTIAMAANPILALVTALALAAIVLITNWDKVAPFFKKMFDSVSGLFTGFVKYNTDLLKKFIPTDLIFAAWDGVKSYFSNLFSTTIEIFSEGFRLIKSAIFDYHPAILIYKHWDDLPRFFLTILPKAQVAIVAGFQSIKVAIATKLDETFAAISKWVSDVIKMFSEMGPKIIKAVKDGIVDLPQTLGELGAKGILAFIGATDAAKDLVTGAGKDTANSFTEGAASQLDSIANFGTATTNEYVSGITSSADAVAEAGQELSDAVTVPLEDAVEVVKTKFQELSEAADIQRIALTKGADAARIHTLSMEDMSIEEAKAVVAKENYNKQLEKQQQLQEKLDGIVDQANQDLEYSNILLNDGVDAAYAYALELEGMEKGLAESTVATENQTQANIDAFRTQEDVKASIEEANEALKISKIRLNEGEEAARLYTLETQGLSTAKAADVIATENQTKANEDAIAIIGELSNSIEDTLISVLDGSKSAKDAFSDLGDWLTDWLKKKILEFASNAILVSVGLGDTTALTEGLTALKAVGSKIISGIGSVFGGSAAVAGTSGTAGGLGAAGASAGLPAASSIGPAVAAAAPVVAALVVAYIGKEFLSSALGGDVKARGNGVEVGVGDNGALEAQNFQDYSKRKALWSGTKRWTEYDDVDSDVFAGLNTALSSVTDSVVNQFEQMGSQSSDAILSGFNVESVKLYAATFDEDLAEWLASSQEEAYRVAINNASPKIQSLISDQVGDITEATGEELAQASTLVSTAIGVIGPAFESLGVDFGNASDTVIHNVSGFGRELELTGETTYTAANNMILLTEALGGADLATQKLNYVMQNLAPEAIGTQFTIDNMAGSLTEFDAATQAAGFGTIRTKDALYEFITSQEKLGEAGIENIAIAVDNAAAVIALSEALEAQQARTTAITETFYALGVSIDPLAPTFGQASEAIVELMGGFDAFTSQTSSYIDQYYSDSEKESLARNNNAASILALNETLGLSQGSYIDTKEELRAFVDSLDNLDTDPAQQSMFALAMSMADGVAEFDAGGKTLTEVLGGISQEEFPNFEYQLGQSREQLNQFAIDAEAARNQTSALSEAFIENARLTAESTAATEYINVVNQQLTDGLITQADATILIDNLKQEASDKELAATQVLIDAANNKTTIEIDNANAVVDATVNAAAAKVEAEFNANDAIAANQAQYHADQLRETQVSILNRIRAEAEANGTLLTMSQQIREGLAKKRAEADAAELADKVVHVASLKLAQLNADKASLDLSTKHGVEKAKLLSQQITDQERKLLSLKDNAIQKFQEMNTGILGKTDTIKNTVTGAFGDISNSVAGVLSSISKSAFDAKNAADQARQIREFTANRAADFEQKYSTAEIMANINKNNGIDGSHMLGLAKVPYDGYIAETHKDEAILTPAQAEKWRNGEVNRDMPTPVRTNNNNSNVVVLNDIKKELMKQRESNEKLMARNNQLTEMVVNGSYKTASKVEDLNNTTKRNIQRTDK